MMSFRDSYSSRPWEENRRGRGRGGFQRTRGSYQGFSGRSARGNYGPGTSVQPPTAEPPLGSLLSTLRQAELTKAAGTYESESVITDCVTVTSYNWLDRPTPTIAVPGKPARWTPLSEPRQLKPDDGEYFRDPNAAHYPKHPMEPTVLAVLAQNARHARENDVVACGSTLGNLLRFIRGEDKQFRFLVELVEGAVFFIRRENAPRELIPNIQGYGHSFPEAYTTWDTDVKGSVSHQRVISYRFGGLRFLVRFEGDGYMRSKKEDENGTHTRHPHADERNPTSAVDGLAALLDQSRVTAVVPPNSSELTVSSAGKVVEQECIFELKTRSIRKKEAATAEDTFADQLPRLWVSQIPTFILAYHNRGTFEDITVRDARKDVKTWEREQVDALSRLAALVHHIIELVKSRPDGKLEIRHAQVGRLEVREQLTDAGDALSDPVKILWAKERGMTEDLDDDQDYDDDGDEFGWDEGSEPDFTACSADDCGYCGRCSY
ncbi:hypothetical protein KVR01_012537 [Diaporthe batatas]|uniref:uncharacterized protein n=1 Tax=Diaporthe batatas TaxID=748121 RepID=UPI001D03C58C|nr:uncharacterized protein KVR01_012537 [Diaporthe batatas]KAG8157495.1 hypothetical protein KVR01_012537 [Diaporthe batatas]